MKRDMQKGCLTLLLLLFVGLSFAQNRVLVFHNDSLKKYVQVAKGQSLIVEYKGYLDQTELKYNSVTTINDSILMLGKPQLFGAPKNQRVINLGDIQGFRKKSAGTELLKTLCLAGITVGTYYSISQNDNLSEGEQILYSLGVGIGTKIVLELAFPTKKAKHFMKNGWRVRVL
ncbi:hypothetical protein OAA06_00155 [bacterium]|nr:hypothetical protein [bacterium]